MTHRPYSARMDGCVHNGYVPCKRVVSGGTCACFAMCRCEWRVSVQPGIESWVK